LTDEINIEVNRNLCAISYPNAFSPNDDGVNDLFQVKGNFSPLSMDIYNRWGQLIYEKERAIWDGFVQGKKAQQGIYYFILIALDRAGRKIQIKDFIYLVD
jgi:gliding motility-associated-like protein